jgi:hypothetical protein
VKYRNFAHYLVGILTAGSIIVSGVLSVLGFAGFMAYELNEDWHLHDQAYKDILEFLIGFFVAVAGLIAWKLAGGI